MKSIEINAKAKINLSLDVTDKRPDGYHNVKMIMQTIDLHDKVVIEEIPSGMEIACNSPYVPSNCENIAYKAAALIADKYTVKSGIRITIDKRIPVAAGLAGGSSNAAAVLRGMNTLFSLGIDQTELMELGKQIGADVPYCIKGGTSLAEGIGEILTELPCLSGVDIVLVKPRVGVSTPWVYRNLDLSKVSSRPDTDLLIKAVAEKDVESIAGNMKNVLETVTIPRYKIIDIIKMRLLELGALGSMMSGSGPSVFGIFGDRRTAERAYRSINKSRWECFLTKTV